MYTFADVKIKGIAPLLMHSTASLDTTDPRVKEYKELSKKRKKTEVTLDRIARLEWELGLYWDKENRAYIPAEMLEACIVNGAVRNKSRLGKTMKAGIIVEPWRPKLIHDGPDTIEGLWADSDFRDLRAVRVGTSKIMRCRPRFNRWSLEFRIGFLQEHVSRSDVEKTLEDAGALAAIGDFRPRYGRFLVESFVVEGD